MIAQQSVVHHSRGKQSIDGMERKFHWIMVVYVDAQVLIDDIVIICYDKKAALLLADVEKATFSLYHVNASHFVSFSFSRIIFLLSSNS